MKYLIIIIFIVLLFILNVNVCLFVVKANIPRRPQIAFSNASYKLISDKNKILTVKEVQKPEIINSKPLKSADLNLKNTNFSNKSTLSMVNKNANIREKKINASYSNYKPDPFVNTKFNESQNASDEGFNTLTPIQESIQEILADPSITDARSLREAEIAWGQWHANIGNFLVFDYVAKNPQFNDRGKSYITFLVTRSGEIKNVMVKSDTKQGEEIIKQGIYLMAGHRILDFPKKSKLNQKTFRGIIKACTIDSMDPNCNRRHTAKDHPDYEKYIEG